MAPIDWSKLNLHVRISIKRMGHTSVRGCTVIELRAKGELTDHVCPFTTKTLSGKELSPYRNIHVLCFKFADFVSVLTAKDHNRLLVGVLINDDVDPMNVTCS